MAADPSPSAAFHQDNRNDQPSLQRQGAPSSYLERHQDNVYLLQGHEESVYGLESRRLARCSLSGNSDFECEVNPICVFGSDDIENIRLFWPQLSG
jgi:hypothetical protein